jgi:hypothetical protein
VGGRGRRRRFHEKRGMLKAKEEGSDDAPHNWWNKCDGEGDYQ